jgi:uncharacterized protein
MHDAKTLDYSRVAQDLQLRRGQVESVVQLLDEGNTVPFITRYRKERTGGLDEEAIRQIQKRVREARQLADRKQTVLKSIEQQGKLTPELQAAIAAAETPKRLEDLYLPYKPRKRTLATEARERGLEPLALAVWGRDPAVVDFAEVLPTLVNPEKGLNSEADVRAGVGHIVAEVIADTAEARHAVRLKLWETGKLTATRNDALAENQGQDYKDYFRFTEAVRRIPPHRILAINRGERAGVLKVHLEADGEAVRRALLAKLPLADHPHAEFLQAVAEDALGRLLLPGLEREIRRELTDEAEGHAVQIFARNLRSLLLQPPLPGRRILAIDPGFRTGCKLAALDEHGSLLDHAVIFPHPPPKQRAEARLKLEELIRRHRLQILALGNGTACRETEELLSELITDLEARRHPEAAAAAPPAAEAPVPPHADGPPDGGGGPAAPGVADGPPAETIPAEPPPPQPSERPRAEADAADAAIRPAGPVPAWSTPFAVPPLPALANPSPPAEPAAPSAAELFAGLPPAPADLAYVVVNEAGASVYSTSAVGREEFPEFDATLRGTISIGRRLQDPLSELVKIDPQNIGVGLYQHDVRPRHLKESLEAVVESSVNQVGIDLNSASVPLLRHVSGLNQLVARELVDYRKQHGPFRSRDQLLQVPGVGPARYIQAAGFLKISGGDNPFDRTWIHPESYPVAQRLLAELGFSPSALEEKGRAAELSNKLKDLAPAEVARRLDVGEATLRDILDALARPGRDPREDLPPTVFRKGLLKLEDLKPGMELKGTVLNVVDFGAFVDVGLKDSGLVHISQMANRFVKSPYEVVAVSDVVTVWVLHVDHERRRVSLTFMPPGTDRKPAEARREPRKPSGRKPPPARAQGGRRQGPPPGAGRASAPAPDAAAQAPAHSSGAAPPPRREHAAPPSTQSPRPAPRKPPRRAPRPKLSQAALEGDVPLRTFGELEAFFKAKDREEEVGQAAAGSHPGTSEQPATSG